MAFLVLLSACGSADRSDQESPISSDLKSPSADVTEPDNAVVEGIDAVADPVPEPRKTFLVTRVVDGDTVELGNGKAVRVVGIDTPEVGECGYEAATTNMVRLVQGKRAYLTVSDEDTDRYGRLLRYVDVGGLDAGLAQIKGGFAIARYDSRDGYGFHPREPRYIRADKVSEPITCPTPSAPKPSTQASDCMAGYAPCLPVVADLDCGDIGHAVTVTGSDPYRLDADGDGIGCDS